MAGVKKTDTEWDFGAAPLSGPADSESARNTALRFDGSAMGSAVLYCNARNPGHSGLMPA